MLAILDQWEIERDRWRVAHPPGSALPEERTVFGAREDAQRTARSMINAWLKKQSALSLTNFR
jgi:hypothetical protein